MDRALYLARTVGLAVAASRDGRLMGVAPNAPYWYCPLLPRQLYRHSEDPLLRKVIEASPTAGGLRNVRQLAASAGLSLRTLCFSDVQSGFFQSCR